MMVSTRKAPESARCRAARARTGFRTIVAALALAALTGCTIVTIDSDPPGAEVYYSANGLRPWLPWPPGAKTPRQTPTRAFAPRAGIYVAHVTKEGYYPSPPQVVDCMTVGLRRVEFALQERPAEAPTTAPAAYAVGAELATAQASLAEAPELVAALERPADRSTTESVWLSAPGPAGAEVTTETGAARQPAAELTQALAALLPSPAPWMATDDSTQTIATAPEVEVSTDPAQTAKVAELVDRIFELGGEAMTSPTHLASLGQALPRVQVLNGTGRPLSVMLSGPVATFLSLPSYTNQSFRVPPGEYRLVIREQDSASRAVLGLVTLQLGDWYYWPYRQAPARPTPTAEEAEQLRQLSTPPDLSVPELPETPGGQQNRGSRGRGFDGRGSSGRPPFMPR